MHQLGLLGMHGVATDGDDGVEAVVAVSRVVDSPLGAVGLKKRVFALDDVSIALLSLVLHVTSV